MKKTTLSLLMAATLMIGLLSACTGTGPGSIITEKKDFAGFTDIEVEGTFDVEITRSDSFSITIRADSNFYDYVTVSQEEQTLKIYLSSRHILTDFTVPARVLKAEITMPALYSLNLAGASQATVSGFSSSKDFYTIISGASSLNLNKMAMHDLDGEVSGASKISGSINATEVRMEVSGASNVNLSGSAQNIILGASGASKVNLPDLPLDNARVDLSGASETTVNVKGELDCDLSGASRLYFQGNPVIGNVKISGASTIKHR